MRPWLRISVVVLAAGGLATGLWTWANRQELAWQWASYRVGKAATFEEARALIAPLERGTDRDTKLRRLVRCWGRGDLAFDLHLVRYVDDRTSSEAIRKAFSLEMAWRDGLLPRWAHYWCWRAAREPHREIASLVDHLDLMVDAEPLRALTWREVLDLQAVFELTGASRLARRLSPENWQNRYRRWAPTRPKPMPQVPRPNGPFALNGN